MTCPTLPRSILCIAFSTRALYRPGYSINPHAGRFSWIRALLFSARARSILMNPGHHESQNLRVPSWSETLELFGPRFITLPPDLWRPGIDPWTGPAAHRE